MGGRGPSHPQEQPLYQHPEPPGLDGVEQERYALLGDPVAAGLQRGCLQQAPGDRPVQQAAHHAEQVIEAARMRARPGGQEVLQQGGREPVEAADLVFGGEAHQQHQLAGLAVVLAAVRALVRDEPLDRGGDGLGHASTCSPLPSATWRSGSMATLA
jgi:hypothetical protein